MKSADLGLLLCGVALNAAAQLGLKAATLPIGEIALTSPSLRTAIPQLVTAPTFWLAIAAYGLSVLVWIVGLSRVPVSQAYPLLSLGYIATAVAAPLLLGEAVSVTRLLGITVIIGGVMLVAQS